MSAAELIRLDDTTDGDRAGGGACVLVIGNFDGVHRGHQAVIAQAVTCARQRATASAPLAVAALTFDPHPAAVLGSGPPMPLLTSLEDRVDLMGGLGVDRLYVRRFDATFAAWSPERFAGFVASALNARFVVVGDDFRFGARRAGDRALLRAMGQNHGFEVLVADVARDARGPYSSTRARDAVRAGDLDEARRVLGRFHAVSGRVVHGDARGRTLGFPTANMEEIEQLLPSDGIYATSVDRRASTDPRYRHLAFGVTSIGVRPTIGTEKRTVETHLLDFADDLYGMRLRIHVVARLRDEMKFASLEELKAKIAEDIVLARSRLHAARDASAREIGA
jgi:riboflavin kinase/FMN adenylyltransferase